MTKIRSEKIEIDFANLTVTITDDYSSKTYLKHNAYSEYLKVIESHFKSKLSSVSTIFNIKGPGMIGVTRSGVNNIYYILVPHNVRPFLFNNRFKELLSSHDDEVFDKINVTQLSDDLWVTNIFSFPELLIVSTDADNQITGIRGGIISHFDYNFQTMSLNCKTVEEFNEIKTYRDISNCYTTHEYCTSISSNKVEFNMDNVYKLFQEVHNSDLFLTELSELFVNKVNAANKQITQDLFIELSKEMVEIMKYPKTIKDISPLLSSGD